MPRLKLSVDRGVTRSEGVVPRHIPPRHDYPLTGVGTRLDKVVFRLPSEVATLESRTTTLPESRVPYTREGRQDERRRKVEVLQIKYVIILFMCLFSDLPLAGFTIV